MPVKRLAGIKPPKAAAKKPRSAPTPGIAVGKPKTSVSPATNGVANIFRGTKSLKGAKT